MTETIPHPRTQVAADRTEDNAPESAKPGLLVLAPLRIEANAVRRGLTRSQSHVLRTGMGATRAKQSVTRSNLPSFGAVVVMGTAAGLAADLSPGDLVVASEVSDGETTVKLPGAELLAAELRRAGLSATAGRMITVSKLVKAADRARLAADGYLAADMETAALLGRAGGRPVAVIRAVSDAGIGPGMVSGGVAAPRALRRAAPGAGGGGAIESGERALELRGAPVYVRKQIGHNTRVVAALEGRGAVFVDELDEVPDGAT